MHFEAFEDAGHGKDISDVIVHEKNFLVLQHSLVEVFEHAPLAFREFGSVAMEQQGGFIEQAFRRADILDDNALGQLPELGLLFLEQIPGGVNNDRNGAQVRLILELLQQLDAGHIGQAQVEHDAIEPLRVKRVERLFARGRHGGLHVAVADQLAHVHLLSLVILHQQQVLHWALQKTLQCVKGGLEVLFVIGFFEIAKGALGQGRLRVLIHCNYLHRDVARG